MVSVGSGQVTFSRHLRKADRKYSLKALNNSAKPEPTIIPLSPKLLPATRSVFPKTNRGPSDYQKQRIRESLQHWKKMSQKQSVLKARFQHKHYCPLSSSKRGLRVCFHCLSGVGIVTLNRSCRIRPYTPDAGGHGELFWSGFWLRWFSLLCTHWSQVCWHNTSLVCSGNRICVAWWLCLWCEDPLCEPFWREFKEAESFTNFSSQNVPDGRGVLGLAAGPLSEKQANHWTLKL